MRKIKECITDSMETVDYTEKRKDLPLAFSWFLRSIATILILDSNQRLSLKSYDVQIGDDKYSGKAKTHPDVHDYVDVLTGNDLMRSMSQEMQLQNFLNWFIDQNEPEGGDAQWYDIPFVLDKWNEFAKMK